MPRNVQKMYVAWRTEDLAAHCFMDGLKSKNEEADIKIILHATNSMSRETTCIVTEQKCFSTVVLKYLRFTESLSFIVPTSGKSIDIRKRYLHYWEHSLSALPVFHALLGCNSTRSLSRNLEIIYFSK